MTIEVDCPHCGRLLRAPDSAAGRRAKCPECEGLVPLPYLFDAEEVGDFEESFASVPPRESQRDPSPGPPSPRRPCPLCGEMIPVRAARCRFCGEQLGSGIAGPPVYHAPNSQGMAIASMVLGICGLVLFCFWPISVPLAGLAIIFSSVDLASTRRDRRPANGMAVAGLVCGILPLAFWVIAIAIGTFDSNWF